MRWRICLQVSVFDGGMVRGGRAVRGGGAQVERDVGWGDGSRVYVCCPKVERGSISRKMFRPCHLSWSVMRRRARSRSGSHWLHPITIVVLTRRLQVGQVASESKPRSLAKALRVQRSKPHQSRLAGNGRSTLQKHKPKRDGTQTYRQSLANWSSALRWSRRPRAPMPACPQSRSIRSPPS